MSTNSSISVVLADGSVNQIYCHFDGYPSHNGVLLANYYNTQEQVEELIALGNLSVLGKFIHPTGQHSFDHPQDDVCIYYGRDRGESDQLPKKYSNLASFELNYNQFEYNYLFKNGIWWVNDRKKSDKSFVELQKLVQ